VGHRRRGAEALARWSGTELTRGAPQWCSAGVDSDEERWARTGVDGCSGGAALGSSSLAMQWMARPEELVADLCTGRRLSAASARSAPGAGAAALQEARRGTRPRKGELGRR
jgi:hypothetical protein